MQKSMPFVATTSINHIETLVFFQENSFKHFSSDQSLGHVQLFVTPWTAARQASLSITNSQSLLELMSIELMMPSNHLILCHSLLLPPSVFPSIRVFSSASVLWYIYTMEYYSAIKKNAFESVLMKWVKLEPIIRVK